MIRSYGQIWPSHPFVFRVPYQDYPKPLKRRYGEKIELVRTPPEIKPTVLGLLADIADDEWIYWCIDDKYLIRLDETIANHLLHWVETVDDITVSGVLFCRCRRLLNPVNLRTGTEIALATGERLIERDNYYQIWIHQFIRAKILKSLFESFPDRHFSAIEMDAFTGQREELPIKKFEPEQKMYVVLGNIAVFGESTTGGKITRNCFSSMQRAGMDIPENFPLSYESMRMGKLPVGVKLRLAFGRWLLRLANGSR